MRVLIFHGYLLHGTGSNVYNAELARALVRGGHEVHLLCQDRDPLALDWVDAAGDWDGGALSVRTRREPPRATVYRPDIAGLLPLYVADRYEGVEARPFPELDDAELERYVERNVTAVREVAERARPDVALANHLVMGPAILARALAGVPYAVKTHGSALEYVVKPHRERFAPYAAEGLAGARGVLVGSRHTAESLWAAMDDPDLPARTRLGPPGVDVERFAPREPDAARAGLEALRARLAAAPAAGAPVDGTTFDRDPRAAAAALAEIAPADRPVIFVGKLIGSKGIELLLAAWPLVLAREPAARLVIVGFGTFRPGLERLAAVLGAGDLEAAAATRAEDGRPLEHLSAFLAGLDGTSSSPPGVPGGGPRGERAAAYRAAAAGLAERVSWVGRLEHDELADLLPACEAMAVPSTFPEAFGMVAAEAAACAALPVVANHSGLGEVARTLAAAVPPPARPWLAFDLGPSAVAQLAGALAGWLGADARLRAGTRAAMVTATRERYSWEGVGRTVIAAARGELAGLPSP